MKYLFFFIFITSVSNGQKTSKTVSNCATESNTTLPDPTMTSKQKNVLGTDLILASINPLTGFFRTGFCETDASDRGVHVVAAVVTDAFLQYSLSQGNNLISPNSASGFPGLKEGDVWCLCAMRWKEALKAGVAPPVILEATNRKALDFVSLEVLKSHEAK